MDNEQERNEHFKGFAELLLNDLKPDMTALFIALGSPLLSRDEEIEKAQRLLMLKVAQRAYDLTMHVLSTMDPLAFQTTLSDDEIMKSIPDLTKWTKTQEQEP